MAGFPEPAAASAVASSITLLGVVFAAPTWMIFAVFTVLGSGAPVGAPASWRSGDEARLRQREEADG